MDEHTAAKNILSQLGGSRFSAMTGARDFVSGSVGDSPSLLFRLPRGMSKSGINKVRITLEPSDTYTVDFLKCDFRKCTFSTVASRSQVYSQQLRTVFEENTGLYTSL